MPDGDQQYIKLPDGSIGAFPASMADADIASVIRNHFPPGAPSGLPEVPRPKVSMQPNYATQQATTAPL